MKFYIAGKITGDSNYKDKFYKAEEKLKSLGHSVMNPACLSDYKDFTWEDYMAVTSSMQKCCDAVLFLPDWIASKGAKQEHEMALSLNQKCFYDISAVPKS